MYKRQEEDWRRKEIELVVSLSGIDGTFGHTIQARYSYTCENLVYDAAFVDVIYPQDDGHLMIDYKPFHDIRSL